MYRISEHEKHRIIAKYENGMSVSDIAEELGVMRNTVYLWVKRWVETGDVKHHASKGRPRKTTPAQDRELVASVKRTRFVNTTVLATTLQVSSLTVRRRLCEAGLRHRIPARKPLLTDRHKALRLQFANRYLDYDFEGVAFMDEKVFVSSADGRLSLWRTPKTRYDEENVRPDRRSGRISLGFWGWMNSSGPIELCEISGRLNGQGYLEILRDSFLPTAKIVYPDNHKVEFMQDNCSIHNSRLVQAWINDNEDLGALKLIKMPPKSPDLNPIENVWGLMVQDWDPTKARTLNGLRAHVNEIWDTFRTTEACQNMICSMKDRLQAVIDADGGYTKY